jgi:hypothetical protein
MREGLSGGDGVDDRLDGDERGDGEDEPGEGALQPLVGSRVAIRPATREPVIAARVNATAMR